MIPSRLFIAHEALEAWVSDGRAEIDAEELRDRETGRRFKLREALRFLEEVTGAPDTASLVGKVKDLESVAKLGGEHMADSVLLGDNAYRVQPGFLGTLVSAIERTAPIEASLAGPPRSQTPSFVMPPVMPSALHPPAPRAAAQGAVERAPRPSPDRTMPGPLTTERSAAGLTPPPLPAAGRKAPKPAAEGDDPMQSQTLVALQKFFLNNVK